MNPLRFAASRSRSDAPRKVLQGAAASGAEFAVNLQSAGGCGQCSLENTLFARAEHARPTGSWHELCSDRDAQLNVGGLMKDGTLDHSHDNLARKMFLWTLLYAIVFCIAVVFILSE
ncbi:MAG: hypothetical protein RL701_4161 [Pseudomonadota bacterium]|jgi:hypothetical protein